ncbi:MAG: hypothetical protein ACI8W8_002027 [Rhodothermales bacterium]|jgi:hypothetical protein
MLATKRIILAIALIGAPHALRASDADALINRLESVPAAETRVYQWRDRNGTRMDCLKLFQPADDECAGIYFGVYHALKHGVLHAQLARSRDLRSWQHLAALDDYASQPTIHVCAGGGYLLAYEKDAPNSCWMRLRFYKDLPDLLNGKHQRQFDVPRTLAPTAEGTPSIESVRLGESGIDKSEIQLRFH